MRKIRTITELNKILKVGTVFYKKATGTKYTVCQIDKIFHTCIMYSPSGRMIEICLRLLLEPWKEFIYIGERK